MSPEEKIAHGLALTGEGIGELRIQRERLHAQLEDNRAALVGGEEHARALRWQAHRARRPRHLLPGEVSRPAPQLYDGLRGDGLQLDARTALGLRTAALLPAAPAPAPAPLRSGWLGRLLGILPLVPLCPRCLHAPCLCSTRIAPPTDPRSS